MSGEIGWRERLRAAGAVARRDLLEFVRDRRTLFITLLMPMAMYPVLALSSTLGLRTALSDLEAQQAPRPLAIVASGPDAPRFAARLDIIANDESRLPHPDWPASLTIDVQPPDRAKALFEEGKADVWLDVASGAIGELDGDGTVKLAARVAGSGATERRIREHVTAVMRRLADVTRQRRIARAGLPRTTLEPLVIDFVGGTQPASAPALRGVVPTAAGAVLVLLALLTATGAFYPAIDAIAGEKERGTVETLLIAPCGPGDIVLGKFLAVFAVTLMTLAMNALSIALTAAVLLGYLPDDVRLGVGAARAAACAGVTLVGYVGLAALAAAMCLAVTAASKSVKEAQNTLTPVILLVSALAGSALLPGREGHGWFAAVPFAGQVAIAKATLAGEAAGKATPVVTGGLVASLALSLLSSAALTWLLLRTTAGMITDEELLFRGPDSASGVFKRPAARRRPTPAEGFVVVLGGLAALWYSQGIAPEDLARALPLQQALAVVLPLVAATWWQRVDAVETFGLRWPCGGGARGWGAVVAAALAGLGMFAVGATLLLALRGTALSPEARRLSERVVDLVQRTPWWFSWALIALVPAVCEELFFRGWLLSALRSEREARGRTAAAVALQAAAFAVFHLLPERMPQTLLLGLLTGWMVVRSGSLVPAIVAHVVHNSVPLVLLALAGGAETTPATVESTGLPPWTRAAAAGSLILGVVLFSLIARPRTAASAAVPPHDRWRPRGNQE